VITLWHALVASTAGTDVRLRLRSEPAAWQKKYPGETMRVLSSPSYTELVQRLTALDICIADATDVAIVYSLAALRHLRLWSVYDGTANEVFATEPGAEPPCQLSELRTLQLQEIWPLAFFTPGVAASLPLLRSVCLCDCHVDSEDGVPWFPDEVLWVPSLERLELIRLPMYHLPDMRESPALRTLIVCDGPKLSAVPMQVGYFGGVTGLTHLSLHNTLVDEEDIAESIWEMPHLKELRLDFWGDESAAFWAATLQRRLEGRCSVRPSSQHLLLDWAGNDW
jgi:hypothetical protein